MDDFPARQRSGGLRSALLAALTSVSSIALIGPSTAQTLAAETEARARDYDIPAQPLSAALLRFADQSGLQLLLAQDDVQGFVSRPLRGRYAPEAALTQMLPDGAPRVVIQGDQIVRAETNRPQQDADLGPIDSEIVVTGTSIRGAAPTGANLITLDRDTIEQSGRTSVASLLQTLPQASAVIPNEVTQLNSPLTIQNYAFGTAVDLRGLGADATLTLVNGRRMAAAAAGNFVDISGIPLAAIERVEVLADGASATYGTDAVGGVVNFILRRDFSGAETGLHFGGATRGGVEDYGFSQVLGGTWDRGSLVGAYEYHFRGELAKADRDFSASTDLTPLGGGDYSGARSNPGTIFSIGGNPVIYGIPFGQDGTNLSEADLLPGVINFHNDNEGAWLMPRQETHSLFLSGRYALTPNFELFFDGLAAQRDALVHDAQLSSTLTVPETNAYRQLNNLFVGQGDLTIGYNFYADLGAPTIASESREHSIIFGGDYRFQNDWRLEASIADSSHVDEIHSRNYLDSGQLAAPLASSDLDTAFNPFAAGSNTNAAVLAGLTQRQDGASDSNIIIYALKADGALFQLPGGPLRAAFGIERRDEDFSIYRNATSGSGVVEAVIDQAPGQRTTDAVYGELLAPFVGPDQNIPLINSLSISASLRHESSSDFGETTNPKIGVNWGATPDLALHATWGTSFKAPQFFQLGTGSVAFYSLNPAAVDPYATNGSTGVLQLAGGNPDLEAEHAESWTAGISFEPSFARGLSLDATYFDIDFTDRVSSPGSALSAFQSPVSIGGYFIRNPTQAEIDAYTALAGGEVLGSLPPDGVEAIFDGRLTNLASQRVRGVDLQLNYAITTAHWGEFSFSAGATGLLQFTTRATPTSPDIDTLNTIFNQIDWRGRLSVGWSVAPWDASIALNYANAYENDLFLPAQSIDADITTDARLAYTFADGGGDAGTTIAISVQNLTDEDPPFVDDPIGMAYDPVNGQPIGRFVSLELVRRW